ncbi:N6-adenosine-specific RNA methylase IME4 [Azospirillum agricola]|uniref:MT-A70 family methyltransferase n=1 Tax=Azospirillum agricola TaxID=1720247 RepID=UPI001AE56D10|nr:MT-A70 family methyltransferase [Azospirillum agricola]MBP2229643.1 N6-adenosine-specific RNA methylase IME4 [Azospirillum agricola]
MNPSSSWPFGNLTPGAYGVILADPPWKFKTWGALNGKACPYDTMTLDDIRALPVGQLAARDCMLVMWTTAPFLPLSLEVLRAWGFSYSTMGSWAKLTAEGAPAIGTGYYWRSSSEPWLIGTRGSPGRWRGLALPNSIIAPRREHSRKPPRLHADLESAYPERRKCELFARAPRNGWDVWGNETEKFEAVA